MRLAKGLDGNSCVSREAIYQNALSSMTRISDQRLLKEGEKKIKYFEEICLQDFRAVDEDAKRWNYSEQEIYDWLEWMINNRECLNSPNKKDNMQLRDMFGALNHVFSISLYCST